MPAPNYRSHPYIATSATPDHEYRIRIPLHPHAQPVLNQRPSSGKENFAYYLKELAFRHNNRENLDDAVYSIISGIKSGITLIFIIFENHICHSCKNCLGVRPLLVLGSGGWVARRRVTAILVMSVILAASSVSLIQFVDLFGNRGGVYALGAPLDYSAALEAFTRLGARIVAVGPRDFVDTVEAQAQGLGLGILVVSASPSQLPLVVSEFNRSLILDDFGAQPVNYTLAAGLATRSFIMYLNTTPTTLQSTVDDALYLFEHREDYYLVTLPLLTSGPVFVAEGFTALGGYPFVDVDYNTTLQGFVYAWYESFHDPPSDPCGESPPSGYYMVTRFTDLGNPYSDGYTTWSYDECIGSPTNPNNPEWSPFNTYSYSDVVPASNHTLKLQGLAVNTNYGYPLYKEGQASTFVSYDNSAPYPVSQNGTVNYNLYYYNFFGEGGEPPVRFIVRGVSGPVSVTGALDTTNGGLTANDTWVFAPSGYDYGTYFVSSVGEADSLWLPNNYQSLYAYMMLDSNFTLASQPYSPNIYMSCVNYYYYALRVQWEVVYNSSALQPPQSRATPTLTHSGPYSAWSTCTYHSVAK
jgi:hypothetical protein